MLDLLDAYAAVWPYLFIGLCSFEQNKNISNKYLSKGMVELCIIAYVYGYSNFIDDIYEMTGSKVLLYKCDFFYIFIHLP